MQSLINPNPWENAKIKAEIGSLNALDSRLKMKATGNYERI